MKVIKILKITFDTKDGGKQEIEETVECIKSIAGAEVEELDTPKLLAHAMSRLPVGVKI